MIDPIPKDDRIPEEPKPEKGDDGNLEAIRPPEGAVEEVTDEELAEAVMEVTPEELARIEAEEAEANEPNDDPPLKRLVEDLLAGKLKGIVIIDDATASTDEDDGISLEPEEEPMLVPYNGPIGRVSDDEATIETMGQIARDEIQRTKTKYFFVGFIVAELITVAALATIWYFRS